MSNGGHITLMDFVDGPQDAKILLIGEAWGEKEEEARLPFQGQSGKVLNDILGEVGLPRAQVAITNVIHERPPNNNFKTFYDSIKGKTTTPSAKLLAAYERLRHEIIAISPNVIVPLGAEALKAVMGEAMSITHWRGSVLESPLGKVLPTIHPAAILRKWDYRPAVVNDFERIVKEGEFKDVRQTERELVIVRTAEEALREIEAASKAEWCSFDIEVESDQITCIGLSWELHRAVCIPFWFGASGSFYQEDKEAAIWSALRGLLESELPKKIAHNGVYDLGVIQRTTGIRPRLHFDTMLAFHTLYLELPKGLDFLVSLYTDHPYYKYQRRTGDMETYFIYNATDACLTFECARALREELAESGMEDFHHVYVSSLVDPVLHMESRGVLFDTEARNRTRRQYRYDISVLQARLEELVGHPLNTASNPQMVKWLYEELNQPKIYKRRANGTKTLSADEEALDEIYKKTNNEAVKTVIDIRQKAKILSTYLEVKIDEDSHIRCSYNITGTETGRFSSSASSRGTGTNLQNIPPGVVKKLFIAESESILVNADLSQAEARVVAYLAREERLIKVFEEGGDIHRRNAANIFGCEEGQVTGEQREIAKRVVHASNYGMGPRTFAKTAGISEPEAKRLLNQYFATYPRIRQWHMEIRSMVQKTRCLKTPFGRKRVFFNRWGESVFKEALAFIPQSTVADITNQGLLACYKVGLDVRMQVHDCVVVQCREEDLGATAACMRSCMSIPVEINGKILIIPVEVKAGKSWGEMKEVVNV